MKFFAEYKIRSRVFNDISTFLVHNNYITVNGEKYFFDEELTQLASKYTDLFWIVDNICWIFVIVQITKFRAWNDVVFFIKLMIRCLIWVSIRFILINKYLPYPMSNHLIHEQETTIPVQNE